MDEKIQETLKETINQISSIDDEIWGEIIEKAILKNYKKKEHIVENNTVCDFIGILIEGYVRAYSIDEKGVDRTIYFNYLPNFPIISEYESYITGNKSKINIQAITDTKVVIIKKDILDKLFLKNIQIERLGRLISEKLYLEALIRIRLLQTTKAEERYANLIKNNPNIVNNVQDYMIASYLGVTSSSFSKIKRKYFK